MSLENPSNEVNASNTGSSSASQQRESANPEVLRGTTPTNPPPPPNGRTVTHKKHRDWHDCAMLTVEAIGVVFLIAYTTFAALQWLQIRWTNRLTREALNGSNTSLQQTLGKMQDQINQMSRLADNAGTQADRTKDLAVASKQAADAATSTANTASEALIRSARPWMGVDSIKFLNTPTMNNLGGGDAHVIEVNAETVVKNYGPSPALAMRVFAQPYAPTVGQIAKEQNRKFKENSDKMCSLADVRSNGREAQQWGDSIFPGERFVVTTYGGGFVERDIPEGSGFLWVGCISYKDQFSSKLHHTRFCFIGTMGKIGAQLNNCQMNTGVD
jgi:hypothetical protein